MTCLHIVTCNICKCNICKHDIYYIYKHDIFYICKMIPAINVSPIISMKLNKMQD